MSILCYHALHMEYNDAHVHTHTHTHIHITHYKVSPCSLHLILHGFILLLLTLNGKERTTVVTGSQDKHTYIRTCIDLSTDENGQGLQCASKPNKVHVHVHVHVGACTCINIHIYLQLLFCFLDQLFILTTLLLKLSLPFLQRDTKQSHTYIHTYIQALSRVHEEYLCIANVQYNYNHIMLIN